MSKISFREIKALAKGKKPERLADSPFAVLRYSVTLPWTDITAWEYAITLSPEEKQKVSISKEDAKKIIKLHGLVPAYQRECGTVFEAADRPFMKKFSGFHQKEAERKRLHHEEVIRSRRLLNASAKKNEVSPQISA